MGFWKTLVQRRRTALSLLSVLVVASYVFIAATSDSFPTTRADLRDQAVWIQQGGAIGRFNAAIVKLDAYIPATNQFPSPTLLQNGAGALMTPGESGDRPLVAVDPANISLADLAKLAPGEVALSGGNTTAVVDERTGQLWVSERPGVPLGRAPTFDVHNPVIAAVGADGAVHLYSAQTKGVYNFVPARQGFSELPVDYIGLGAVGASITAVGDTTIVMAGGRVSANGTLLATVPGADVTLQAPGPASSVVYVASASGLYAVSLGGGIQQVGGIGVPDAAPLAPVVLSGCVYAGWPGMSGLYASWCGAGAAHPVTLGAAADASAGPVFQLEGTVGVLNAKRTGSAWLLGPHFKLVITPQDWREADAATTTGQAHGHEQNVKVEPPDCRLAAPAFPHPFGARVGRATLIPVLSGGSQCNGVTTLSKAALASPSEGTLSIVGNGESLELDLAPNAALGSFMVRFTVSDGLPNVKCVNGCQGTLDIRVYPATGVNTPPQFRETTVLTAVVGAPLRISTLDYFTDAQGDPMYLEQATPSRREDSASFASDGTVLFTPGAPGIATINLTVVDDHGGKTVSTFSVKAVTAHQAPMTVPDLAAGTVGRPIILHPLTSDWDLNGLPLALSSLTGGAGLAQVSQDGSGAVTVVANQPGTYYLSYVASDVSVTGSPVMSSGPTPIRLDVSPNSGLAKLVVTPSIARLPVAGIVSIPVLDNVFDSQGLVPVVQSVEVPPGSPFSASVRSGQFVVLQDQSPFNGTVPVDVTVTDGTGAPVQGIVDVICDPANAPSAPIAVPDVATVRTGSIGTIDVLANDLSPDGFPLSIAPGSLQVDQPKDATAFVDGQAIDVVAPPSPGEVILQYSAMDEEGQVSAPTTVSILVTAPSTDQAPTAPGLTAHVIAGTSVRIPVPLGNADADGEPVLLAGLASGPSRGSVSLGPDWLEYTAFPGSSGTDIFSYRVTTVDGHVATGDVSVGISPPPALDEPPVTVPQFATTAPGKPVVVPVAANDWDPQGYALRVVKVTGIQGAGAVATIDDLGDLRVIGPTRSGETSDVSYSITDGHGQFATGTLQVTAKAGYRSPPLALDDVVSVLKHPFARTVVVNVLAKDSDPSGTHADLRVVACTTIPRQDCAPDGRLIVPLGRDETFFAYEVRGNGGTAWATVAVPPRGTDVPYLSTGPTITVPEDSHANIVNLAGRIIDPAGLPIRVFPDGANYWSAAPDGSATTVIGPLSFRFTPAPGYVGDAMVTFVVGHRPVKGASAVQPLARLSLLIRVTGRPPLSFFGPAISVVAGHASLVSLLPYLSQSSSRYVFSRLSGGPPNVAASITAPASLRLDARSARAGTSGILSFSVALPGGQPVQAQVEVTVVQTNLPPPVAANFSLTVRTGSSTNLRLIARSTNAVSGRALHFLGLPLLASGPGSLRAPDTYRAPASGSGTAVITYVVVDALGRTSLGRVTITVEGAPGAPIGLTAAQNSGALSVTLSWTAPPTNGASISNYTAYWSGTTTGQYNCDLKLVCVVPSLIAGSYRFSVRAKNVVNWSPPSPETPALKVDLKPAPVRDLRGKAGDRRVVLTWTAPVQRGSPVTSYMVKIVAESPSGAPPVGTETRPLPAPRSNYTWTGLQNGVDYTFSVFARNNDGPSAGFEDSVVPATKPSGVAQLVATPFSDPAGDGHELSVKWLPPQDGGSPIRSYTIDVKGSQGAGKRVENVRNLASSGGYLVAPPITGLSNGVTYTVSVFATNAMGSGPASPRETVTPFGQPLPISNLMVTSCTNGSCELAFTAPPDNGNAISQYRVYESTTGAGGLLSAMPQPLTVVSSGSGSASASVGLKDCYSYTFGITAFNGYWSQMSNATGKTATGKTAVPEVPLSLPTFNSPQTSSSPAQATFSWHGGGGGCYANLTYSGGNVSNQKAPPSNQVTISGSNGSTVTVALTMTDGSPGTQGSLSEQQSATIPSAQPSVSLAVGGPAPPSKCGNCSDFSVTVSNFPTGWFPYSCWDNSGPNGSWYQFYNGTVYVSSSSEGPGGWSAPFCWDNNGYYGYIIIDGYKSNKAGPF